VINPITVHESATDILGGLTVALSGPLLRERLEVFCHDLDALGRVDANGEPLVDERVLRRMLNRVLDEPQTDALVAELRRLPDQRLVASDTVGEATPWFAFAETVTIFDTDTSAEFGELGLADDAPRWAIVEAIHNRFPSLEEELIDPEVVPPAVERLVGLDRVACDARSALAEYLLRQLGWWAVVTFSLLVPGAMYQQRRAHGHDVTAGMTHPWPVFAYLSAATIGGWTLTVVENCLLATDVDRPR